VAFDLDGTLFDHAGSVRVALANWLPTVGAQATDPVAAAWLKAEVQLFPDWLEGVISFDEQRRRRLRDFLPVIGLPVGTDDALNEAFGDYLHAYEAAWRAYEDAEAGLSAVLEFGLLAAVLTNGATQQQRAKLRAIGLAGRAGPIITAEDLGVAKPHPEAFILACSRLGLDPAEVLYVGDDHDTDVTSSRKSLTSAGDRSSITLRCGYLPSAAFSLARPPVAVG
jgi:putative hydrolase of the HAD superfamily